MGAFWEMAIAFLLIAGCVLMFAYNDFYKAMFCLAIVWLYKDG